MSVVKPQQMSSSASVFTLRGSLLTLSIVTLVSFTYISFKSLNSPSLQSPDSPLTSQSQVKNDADLVPADGSSVKDMDASDDEYGDVFHSPKVFRLNYEEMKARFKVYIYSDGDPNTYYQTPRKLTGKYASEGYFFQNLRESNYVTDDPNLADLFFIPISCHKMRGKGISYDNMTIIVQNYVDSLISKYPYWNRTLGADHFFVTCHDVGVRATEGLPNLIKNSIRVVCSPSYDVGFIPHKDVALPQVLQPFALPAGGNDVENRTILGFWAGHRNSKIRVILARVWENDTELDISNNRINRATGHLEYQKRFYRNKFCICPGGSQVNSARIADSIHYGCIPVSNASEKNGSEKTTDTGFGYSLRQTAQKTIIGYCLLDNTRSFMEVILSDFYDLPFNDILNWRKFAVVLKERDVYQLKQILTNITQAEFVTLHNNLVKVQKHFQWNSPPLKHDAFHMVMYELWLRHHVIKY